MAETSTGAWQPLEEISQLVHDAGAMLLVDAVTSLGGVPVVAAENDLRAIADRQRALNCDSKSPDEPNDPLHIVRVRIARRSLKNERRILVHQGIHRGREYHARYLVDDFGKLRAIFEPYQLRTEMLPGEADFEKDGIPRAFDAHLDVATHLHVGGDEPIRVVTARDLDFSTAPRVQ